MMGPNGNRVIIFEFNTNRKLINQRSNNHCLTRTELYEVLNTDASTVISGTERPVLITEYSKVILFVIYYRYTNTIY